MGIVLGAVLKNHLNSFAYLEVTSVTSNSSGSTHSNVERH